MVNYTCPRCGYEIKTKYVNHLRRKNKCINKLNNDLQEEYIKYNIIEKINYTQK